MKNRRCRQAIWATALAAVALVWALAPLAVQAEQAEAESAVTAAPLTPSPSETCPLEAPKLLPPAENQAIGCECRPRGTTATTWGMGANCSAAQSNLNANLSADGDSKCEQASLLFCGITNTVIVTACHLYQGTYRIDGYATYKCYVCD